MQNSWLAETHRESGGGEGGNETTTGTASHLHAK